MSDQSRRKLIKSIAAGSGAVIAGKSLPENWTRPVVDSVLLPSHAQTSGQSFNGPATVLDTIPIGSIDNERTTLFASVADSLIQEAHAGGPIIGQPNGTVCAITVGEMMDVQYQNRNNSVLRRGTIPLSGSGLLSPIATSGAESCNGRPSLTAEIIAITDAFIDLSITYPRGTAIHRINAGGECNLPALTGICD